MRSRGCAGSRAKVAAGAATLGSSASVAPAAPAAKNEAPTLRLDDAVKPTRVALELTLVPERTTFEGRVTIDLDVRAPVATIWLNATDLGIANATIGGKPARMVPGNEDVVGFTTGETIAKGRATIEVAYTGAIDRTKSRGVYARRPTLRRTTGTPTPSSKRSTRGGPFLASISRTRRCRGSSPST